MLYARELSKRVRDARIYISIQMFFKTIYAHGLQGICIIMRIERGIVKKRDCSCVNNKIVVAFLCFTMCGENRTEGSEVKWFGDASNCRKHCAYGLGICKVLLYTK